MNFEKMLEIVVKAHIKQSELKGEGTPDQMEDMGEILQLVQATALYEISNTLKTIASELDTSNRILNRISNNVKLR